MVIQLLRNTKNKPIIEISSNFNIVMKIKLYNCNKFISKMCSNIKQIFKKNLQRK